MVDTVSSPESPAPPPPASAASPSTRAELRAQRQKGPPRFWRRKLVWAGIVVLALILAAVGLAWSRLASYTPRSTLSLHLPPTPAERSVAKLPWPSAGEAAFAVPAYGISEATPTQNEVPIASLTKMMTAYVLLSDHPLADGQDGPSITLTIADAVEVLGDSASDQAYVPVQSGEVLTERQLLQGLLVHSANNFADALATWDAGSLDNFVSKMNYTARVLGLENTNFADPSGLNPASMSTPADLVRLAEDAMQIPAFAETVSMPSVTLPVAGTLASFTPLLAGGPGGVPGVVGVKSGYTSEAGGCDVMVYRATVNGQPVRVVVAVTGQGGKDPLSGVGQAALGLAQAAVGQLRPVHLAVEGRSVGRVAVRGANVAVVEGGSVTFVAWPDWRLRRTVSATGRPVAGSPAVRVGSVSFELGPQKATVPLQMAARLPVPSLFQRIFDSTG